MTDTIWVALLSLVGTLLGTLGGDDASQRLVNKMCIRKRLEEREGKSCTNTLSL